MTGHRQYKITDYRFGQLILGLREKINLTQKEVADALTVSKRTIQHWEAGTAFPDSNHLKELIAYYLQQGSFTPGHELDEAAALWSQADESASRRKSIFDELWFNGLLDQFKPRPDANQTAAQSQSPAFPRVDWGDAPDVIEIFGRDKELERLKEWVIDEKCRLVTLLGMGGIGKTTLVVKFAQDYAHEFEYVIWRSLRNAPAFQDLLLECLQILSPVSPAKPSLQLLVELLQQHRCLLILDNVETLHQAGNLSGIYRDGYEGYQLLFQKLAQTRHKSCLILTSRESPLELVSLEGSNSPTRVMKVAGLTSSASQSLLAEKGLYGSSSFWDVFVNYYTGNPLALKIAATSVRDLFGGDLAAFLREAPVTLHTLHQLLGNQFEQLSALEKDILLWLAIERDPVDLDTLRRNFLLDIPNPEILSGLLSLRQRSLIERSGQGAIFSLLPVLMEFVTDRLVTTVTEQIIQRKLEIITKHALVKSQSIDQVRDSQVRMILQPVLSLLKRHFGSQSMLADHLRKLVTDVRQVPREAQGYAGGNLVNLLVQLKTNIKGDDFSGLVLCQVYLQGVEAQDADFSGVDFVDSRFTEPLETISAMTLSPSGTYMAASTYNGHIRVWSMADGKPLWTATNASRAWSLAFSPDGTQLACSHFRGRVSLWDVATGRQVHTFEGHQAWVHTVAFHPSGNYLTSAGVDTHICIWDIKEKKLSRVLDGHSARIWSLAFSPDGNLLVSGGDEEAIFVWDFETGKVLRLLHHIASGSINLAFHPNGKWVVGACEQDPHINLWDPNTGEILASILSRSNGPSAVTFSPDSGLLASGGQDGSVEIWHITDENQPKFVKMLMGHNHYISILAFSQHNLLATLSYGEDIRLWNVDSGKLLRVIEGFSRLIGANAFSPDGRLLLQGDASGRIRLWDVQNHNYLAKIRAHTGPIWTVMFAPDGKTFATAGDDRFIRLWDSNTLNCLKTFTGHAGSIWCLAFSRDGSVLASSGSPHGIRVWDPHPDTDALELMLIPTSHDVWSLLFDKNQEHLVSGYSNGEVVVWDAKSGQALVSYQHGTVPIGTMRCSLDGKTLITSSNDPLLKFWDSEMGECTRTIPVELEGNRTKAVAIGEDGKLVATGSGGQNVFIWKVQPGDTVESVTIEGHTNRVWAIALSQDERLLASSDEEGTTIISDVPRGEVIEKILIDRPYERMNIRSVTGLNPAERAALKALGAIETDPR